MKSLSNIRGDSGVALINISGRFPGFGAQTIETSSNFRKLAARNGTDAAGLGRGAAYFRPL